MSLEFQIFKSRTGVFSTARYDPEWRKWLKIEDDYEAEDETIIYQSLYKKQEEFNRLLFRSLKVLAHEITHTFCMPHCPYYEWLMNGSNTIIEGRRKPMHLWPVCIRKLQSVIGFDIIERYEKIVETIEDFENPNFDSTLEWYKLRLSELKKRANDEYATKPFKTVHDELPIPKTKFVKRTVKRKIPKPEEAKQPKGGKKLTAIQRLILERKNKQK